MAATKKRPRKREVQIVLHARVSKPFKETFDAEAKAQGRTVAQHLRWILENSPLTAATTDGSVKARSLTTK